MRRALLLLVCAGAARDYSAEIGALLEERHAGIALRLLDEWKAHGGEKEPEYFLAGGRIWYQLAPTVSQDEEARGSYAPGHPPVGLVRLSEHLDEGHMQRAYEMLGEGARRFPQRLDVAVQLAELHRVASDLPGELAALRALVTQARGLKKPPLWGNQPANTTAEALGLSTLNRHAAEHFRMGERTAAKEVGELMVELFPEKSHGYNLVGRYFVDSQQYETARQWLEKALAHAPDDSLVLASLADCQERLGHRIEAADLYKRIVQLNNDPELVTQAKRALKKRK